MHTEVAVVLPCYNVERYLQRALDSVLVQTFRNFHVYAVDDGSVDRTVRILQSNSHRCSFVSQSNAGPAAARNRAIGMSDSEFVAFLDADDEWLPSKLEKQLALLKQDATLGMVCSGCVAADTEGERPTIFESRGRLVFGKLFQTLVRDCFVFTPTVILRRRCLEETGLFNETLAVSEDFNLWLRIAARWRIAFLPEVLAITYKRPESLSASIPPVERLRTGIAALESVQARCPELSPAERRALRIAIAERYYFHGSFLLTSGAKQRSRHSLASALKLQPTHWKALTKLGLSYFPANSERYLLKGKPTLPAAFH
jgi:glycosyltransferase involved in cell wall biosynthesis